QVRPGGWFACACHLPVHEACAVFTLHGWHTEQVFEELPEAGQCVLVLQRPMGQAFRKVVVDWAAERHWWRQRKKGRTRAARSSIAAAPSAPGRRCHVFGVGIAKSGTSSLAGMFEAYRSAHE